MTDHPSRAGTIALVGADLALDFCNTASGRGGPEAREHLQAARHVVDWAAHAGVLTDEARDEELARLDEIGPDLLDQATTTRDCIHRCGTALAAGRQPDPADLDLLGRQHAANLATARLAPQDGGYGWAWAPADGPVQAILGPIVLSALLLLTRKDLTRVKECPGNHCGWLFFDTTKNKTRRWCDMSVCGNRAKQTRHVQRRRQAETSQPR